MHTIEIVQSRRADIMQAAASRGASNIRIFGSVAKGEEDAESDIDLLVDLEAGRSLFDLGGLLMDLQDILDRPVHLVTENALHWYIKDRVLSEAVPL